MARSLIPGPWRVTDAVRGCAAPRYASRWGVACLMSVSALACARSTSTSTHGPAASAQTRRVQLGVPDRPRNLRVLPESATTLAVVAEMRTMTSALGVTCQFCHQGSLTSSELDSVDFASDAKPSKATARRMMRLVALINGEIDQIRPAGNSGALQVSCITCHRASPRPLMLEDTLRRIVESAGVDAAVRAYAALRARYYGRFAYDFGERSLTVLAMSLVQSGKVAEARRILQLNEALFPDSWNVANELARVHERLGEIDLAVARYRRVLELFPSHEGARARVKALTQPESPPTLRPTGMIGEARSRLVNARRLSTRGARSRPCTDGHDPRTTCPSATHIAR